MKFKVKPYIGTEYITFGMTQDDVARRIGQASSETKSYCNEKALIYFGITIGFDKESNLVNHIGISEDINVTIDNINVFTDPEALKKLMLLDGEPYRYLDDIYLLKYGVCLSGFESDDESDEKNIVLFIENKYLDVKEKGERIII